MTYWDPTRALAAVKPDPVFPEGPWGGRWEDRDRLNVPGPFWTGMTDTCLTGRLHAPDLVLYDDDGCEFVFRQPRTPAEVGDLYAAACEETLTGYGHDGDLHWTPDLVREWWHERAGVREWAMGLGWGPWVTDPQEWRNDAAAGARAYVAHIDGDLGGYLRGYLFRLREGRPARVGEALPGL
ncbi:ferredoxin [Streptomyces sp. NPDC058623]|uniref:ferredoxin n=1 Tax=Streptomyces sp. NPDC058623 TaxID=3346563 RepID=UPI0036530AB5